MDQDYPCGSIRIVKNGPEDYVAYVEEYNTGSSTDRGGESIAEVLNQSLQWMGLEITVTVG